MRVLALVIALLIGCEGGAGMDEEGVEPESDDRDDFVRVDPGDALTGPRFTIRGRPFAFIAANAYYVQEEATRELAGRDTAYIDETFAKLSALGVRVVRAWAFGDDPTRDTVIQKAPLVYSEAGLRGLDTVIAKAREFDLRLILTLSNYWSDYGGIAQYVRWRGLADPQPGDARFFTDRAIRDHYKAHLERIIGRVNSVTHQGYWEDPTILGWELMNEPRGAGLGDDGMRLREWIDDIAGHIHQLAPNQLVTTGEEGFDTNKDGYDAAFWHSVGADWMWRLSQSFTRNVASPWVDYASVHFYPERYGWPSSLTKEAGIRWIVEHALIASKVRKPLVVGEFGLMNQEVVQERDQTAASFFLETRRDMYAAWLDVMTRVTSGAAPWLYAYDDRPDDWDTFSWYFRDGSEPGDPKNRYADLIIRAAAAMGGR